MPGFNYILLSYHASESSKKGVPLILLLAPNLQIGLKHGGIYLHPEIADMLLLMPENVQEWMMYTLEELNREQEDCKHLAPAIFHRYASLSVGPLRTAVFGSMEAEHYDNVYRVLTTVLNRDTDIGSTMIPSLVPTLHLSTETLRMLRLKLDFT